MRHLPTDVAHAVRALRRRPGLAVVATLTLALGIGANTAVFSVAWGAWLRPLPYPDADRLVRISDRHESFDPGRGGATVSIGDYVDLKEGNRTFASTTVFTWTGAPLGEGGERASVLYTEPTLFETLGISPVTGRAFDPEDTAEGGRAVILSHGLWQRRFGGAQDVVGRDLLLGDEPWTVVGVAPEELVLPREVDVIVPFTWTAEQRSAHGGRSMQAIGRLRPGVSLEAARADLQAIYAEIAAEHPESHEGWTSWVSPFREYVVGEDQTVLQLMGSAALLLLLVACVNVASLLLARAESRHRELAVRTALGAGRGRILTSFLGESLVIGVLGGAVGIAVAYGGVELLVSVFGDELRRPSGIALEGAPLAVAVGLTLVTILVVALVPALRVERVRLTDALRQTPGSGRRGVAIRRGLVIFEIALAVVLVSGAGLLVNTVWRLTRADLGFEPRGAVALYLELPGPSDGSERELPELYRGVLESLEAHPAISAAGASGFVPPNANLSTNDVIAAGRPETETDFVGLRTASPGYFDAVGVDFVAGSPFSWTEPREPGDDSPAPAVIDELLAGALFDGESPLGRLVDTGSDLWRVVGVVEATRQRGAAEPPGPMLYRPWPATPVQYVSRPTLIVRGVGGGEEAEAAVVAAAREVLGGIDPRIRFTPAPLREGVEWLYRDQSFALSLVGLFAGLALLLGAVGIYGIVSYTVAQRTREMGIRIALGAARDRVLASVVLQGLLLTAAGLAVGLAAAALAGRYIATLLYDVSPADPLTYGTVGLLFLATAALACVVPGRRAASVEPTVALREE